MMTDSRASGKPDAPIAVSASGSWKAKPAYLGDQLVFALTAATKAVSGAYRTHLVSLGITLPQYLVLLALWTRDAQTVSQIGEAVLLDSGTLSPLLRRLEKAGYVTRGRTDDDERRVIIALTPEGRELEPAAAKARMAVESLESLAPHDLETLRRQLLQIAQTIEHASGGGSFRKRTD